jgi:hypothetical protein
VTGQLTNQQVRTMFTAMFPESVCHAMAGLFVQAVAEQKLKAARKPVRSEFVFTIEEAYESAVA